MQDWLRVPKIVELGFVGLLAVAACAKACGLPRSGVLAAAAVVRGEDLQHRALDRHATRRTFQRARSAGAADRRPAFVLSIAALMVTYGARILCLPDGGSMLPAMPDGYFACEWGIAAQL